MTQYDTKGGGLPNGPIRHKGGGHAGDQYDAKGGELYR